MQVIHKLNYEISTNCRVVLVAAIVLVRVLLLAVVRRVLIRINLRETPDPTSASDFSSAFATALHFLSTAIFFAAFAVRASLAAWLIGDFAVCFVHRRVLAQSEQVYLTFRLRVISKGTRQVPKPILSTARHEVQYPPSSRNSISLHSRSRSVVPASWGVNWSI